ncbi:hemicentin-1-like [Zerene cesonia]|uniref:hemicentin-1-like n=1 Tax=Zerene cesonia TaxID=33412 RepID=UPI0018E516F1|nr:hemicentin-1-like [Zerene cesonia]
MSTYLIFILCYIPLAICTKGVTLVVDTTKSMSEEKEIIKSNINIALCGINKLNYEFMFLPFNNPEIGPPIMSSSCHEIMGFIDLMEMSGGYSCPEKSLSALEMALQRSKSSSYIFLFTDARPEDTDKLGAVQTLCRTQQSQVFIFLSDKCHPTDTFDMFHEVAKSCAGAVYYFDLWNLREAFTYMKEIMRTDWSEMRSREEIYGNKRFSFSVDTYTSNIIIGISGEYPDLEILNNFEHNLNINQVVSTRHAKVLMIVEPPQGEYFIEAQCRGYAVVTFLAHTQLQFKYGFSPKKARSLNETSGRPLPGTTSYIFVELPDTSIELTSAELHFIKTNDINTLKLEQININKGLYMATHLFEPGKSFRLSLRGSLQSNGRNIKGLTKYLDPQHPEMVTEWIHPEAEILDPDSILLDFGLNATLGCKVESFPSPEVWWEDDQGDKLPSETVLLEIPSTYISYMRIDNATRNGTVLCKAKNALDTADDSIEVFINRTFTFEVLQYPTDTTVEYGEEGRLFCEVNAYPEAEIKWFHNGTEVEGSDDIELLPDENLLLIKEMSLNSTGEYVCEIKNDAEFRSYEATVYVTGLDPPEVKLQNSEIVLKPGDWTQQECTVLKGKPKPEITWKYKVQNGYDYLDIPDGVYVEENIVKIPSAQTFHAGVFICEATNVMGVDMQEVTIRVQFPPKIKNKDENLIVKQGDLVALSCDVDAVPSAQVHWDMYQDDVIITFDEGHFTDDRNTHRFTAKANDSGMYHCIAENSMGKAMRTVNVNVWVAPYIDPPVSNNITSKAGSTVHFDCYIGLGNPMPATRWVFIAPNSNITVLTVGHSTGSLNYALKNVSRRNEGTYRCIAENEVGVDTIHIYLKVV